MKKILKQIFNDHLDESQKKKNKRAFIAESYHLHERRKYDSPKINIQLPLYPNFSELPEEQLEREFILNNKPAAKDSLRKSHQIQQVKLPSIASRKNTKPTVVKFRAVVWAIRFIHRLNSRFMDPIIKKRRQSENYYKFLQVHVTKLMHGHYQKLLQKELSSYMRMLERSLDAGFVQPQKQIIQMLYDIALKLSTSTVTKKIMQFLIITATDKSFPPSNYLSAMEITRLDFSQKYRCIANVSADQTKMIIGLGLGIKMFCFYVFYQPWKLRSASEKVKLNDKLIRNTTFKVGSIFYFMILEDFCFNLKEIRTVNKEFLSRCELKLIAKLDPYGSESTELTLKELIVNQERQFLTDLSQKYPQIMKSIRENVNKWINRISYICLKQAQQLSKDKEREKDKKEKERIVIRSTSFEPASIIRVIRQKSNPIRKIQRTFEQNIDSYMSRGLKKSPYSSGLKDTLS